MATYTIKGSGVVASADFHTITWTGKTKGDNAVVITLTNAINMSNIDWTFAEKDDVVAQAVFTAAYTNTHTMATSALDYVEPWTVTYTSSTGDGAADEIILGAGVMAIDGTDVALTRGGGQFTVEREFREINADGDRGPVKDRVVIDASRASLTLNALQFLTNMDNVYAGITVTNA